MCIKKTYYFQEVKNINSANRDVQITVAEISFGER